MNTLWDLAVDLAHTHHLDREDTHRTCRVYLEQIEGADAATYDEDDLPGHVAECITEAFRIGAEYEAVWNEGVPA